MRIDKITLVRIFQEIYKLKYNAEMYNIKRTNSDDIDFQNLVIELDKDLAIRDGEEHDFFAQFNKISAIKNVVVLYENEIAVGCGAIKEYEENVMEIKRMFVPLEKRGKGIASIVLKELEESNFIRKYKGIRV